MSAALEEVRSREIAVEFLMRQRVEQGRSSIEEEQAVGALDRALTWMRAERVWADGLEADEERRREHRELLGR